MSVSKSCNSYGPRLTCRRAIHTYSKQGTLKSGIPDPLNHAIIYTSPYPPSPIERNIKGKRVREKFDKPAIKVIAEGGRSLDPESRLNYSKPYPVEKYVLVLNLGMVDPSSMAAIETSSPVKVKDTLHKRGRSKR